MQNMEHNNKAMLKRSVMEWMDAFSHSLSRVLSPCDNQCEQKQVSVIKQQVLITEWQVFAAR